MMKGTRRKSKEQLAEAQDAYMVQAAKSQALRAAARWILSSESDWGWDIALNVSIDLLIEARHVMKVAQAEQPVFSHRRLPKKRSRKSRKASPEAKR